MAAMNHPGRPTGCLRMKWLHSCLRTLRCPGSSKKTTFMFPIIMQSARESRLWLALCVSSQGSHATRHNFLLWNVTVCQVVWGRRPRADRMMSVFMLSLLFLPLLCFLNTNRVSGYAEMAVKYLFFLSSFFFLSSPSLSFKEWHQERRRNAWQLPRRLRSWLSEVQRLLKCRLRARRKRRHQNVLRSTLSFSQVIDTEPERCCWEMDRQIDGLSLLWYVCNVAFTNPRMVSFFFFTFHNNRWVKTCSKWSQVFSLSVLTHVSQFQTAVRTNPVQASEYVVVLK